MGESVRCEVVDNVATVTMDRPPVNAVSPELLDALTSAFDALSDRDDVRAAILTGAGRVFCAGADLKSRGARSHEHGDSRRHSRRARETFHSIVECRVPVVAAINGPALGAGLALAASCDILVTCERGVLGLPEIDVGLLGGARHAMRLFGHSKTRMMMLTGQRLHGAELARLGVVEMCVADSDLMAAATSIASDIASKSPVAIGLAKRALNAIEEMSLRDGYRFEQDMTAELAQHPDAREAMRAFVEKRSPRFTGS